MENEELLRLYKDTSNKQYLELLFKQVDKFIHERCHSWFITAKSYRVEYDELRSIAIMQFMDVVNNFDFTKEVKFVSVLGRYIDFRFNKLVYREYKKHLRDESLNTVIEGDNSHKDSVTTMLDLLIDEDINIEEDYITLVETQKTNDALSKAISSIAEKDLKILSDYYIRHKTQKEIGEQMGVGQMSISRYLKRITNELRDKMISLEK
jgi:RNA polymerase sigma factor (sigma-70 family)